MIFLGHADGSSLIVVPRFTPGALPQGSFDRWLGHPTAEPSAGFRRRDGKALRRRMLPEVKMETRLTRGQRLELTKDTKDIKDIKVGCEEKRK